MHIRIFLILFILTSCQLDEPFNYTSDQNDLVVLSALLNPDSLISIEVSRASSFPQGTKLHIKDAVVSIFQDNLFIGEASYKESSEKYTLEIFPEEGSVYKISVKVDANKLVEAETSIPKRPIVSGCYSSFKEDDILFNGKVKAIIGVETSEDLWIGAYSDHFYYDPNIIPRNYDSTKVARYVFKILYSNSPIPDDFNLYQDAGLSSYDYYLRIPRTSTTSSEQQNIDLFSFETDFWYSNYTLNSLSEPLGMYVFVIAANTEFDAYMKSTIINVLNSNVGDGLFNPFVEQIAPYSNVQNGAGVVAGYAMTIIPIHISQCN